MFKLGGKGVGVVRCGPLGRSGERTTPCFVSFDTMYNYLGTGNGV